MATVVAGYRDILQITNPNGNVLEMDAAAVLMYMALLGLAENAKTSFCLQAAYTDTDCKKLLWRAEMAGLHGDWHENQILALASLSKTIHVEAKKLPPKTQ